MIHLPASGTLAAVGVLPGLAMRGQTLGVLRLNGRFLIGGDYFWFGPYGDYQSLAPQVTDKAYGGAIRIGHDWYMEAQAGHFERTFKQPGTAKLTGRGFSANLIFGMHLSPHLGVDFALASKRITDGTLDKRWIIDFLPLLTIRGEF